MIEFIKALLAGEYDVKGLFAYAAELVESAETNGSFIWLTDQIKGLVGGILPIIMVALGAIFVIRGQKTLWLFKFILCALAAAERGFARELIISYIKTDFAGLTPDEINLFENYVRKWSISGARFYDEYEWNMNPEGFRGEMTAEGEEKLIRLSEIRKKAILPLRAFCEDAAGRHSVEWFAKRLYSFALELSAPEKIALDAAEAKKRGEKSLAAELTQLFAVFVDALDALVSAAGGEEVGAAEFTSLLRLVLSETDIGRIMHDFFEKDVVEDTPKLNSLLKMPKTL